MNGEPLPSAQIRIPLGMLNRHGLVAGATGTGKTRTLQGLAEQLADKGVPVFAADMKGDLSGMATAGSRATSCSRARARSVRTGSPRHPSGVLRSRRRRQGRAGACDGLGLRPLLLSKVLGLNETQESSLGLVFHYADANGLALVDLSDLRAVLTYLTSDDGKAELKNLGGLSAATAGVILRELITFADGGADVFFGEPEFDVNDFLRTAPTAGGSSARGARRRRQAGALLDVPHVPARRAVRDPARGRRPRKTERSSSSSTRRICSSGMPRRTSSRRSSRRCGSSARRASAFFVTQTPKDVPPTSSASSDRGCSTPCGRSRPTTPRRCGDGGHVPQERYDSSARCRSRHGRGDRHRHERRRADAGPWTRLRAPQGLAPPTPDAQIDAAVAASVLLPRYGTPIDRESGA
jgi:hypothetical protein